MLTFVRSKLAGVSSSRFVSAEVNRATRNPLTVSKTTAAGFDCAMGFRSAAAARIAFAAVAFPLLKAAAAAA